MLGPRLPHHGSSSFAVPECQVFRLVLSLSIASGGAPKPASCVSGWRLFRIWMPGALLRIAVLLSRRSNAPPTDPISSASVEAAAFTICLHSAASSRKHPRSPRAAALLVGLVQCMNGAVSADSRVRLTNTTTVRIHSVVQIGIFSTLTLGVQVYIDVRVASNSEPT